jgi:hypothetical protein
MPSWEKSLACDQPPCGPKARVEYVAPQGWWLTSNDGACMDTVGTFCNLHHER